MNKRHLWYLAKTLELVGMVVVLVGVLISINEGLAERNGLASMQFEMVGLGVGGALFVIGWMIERTVGAR
jgi:hypothetical protein